MRFNMPYAAPGQVVGLFGGSFDPPHAGHVHLTREALKRFGLDQVWWLVTPGNPLKAAGPAALEKRIAAARRMMQHPKVRITGIEAHLGTRYTAETLRELQRLYPRVRFVWLMGADNLAQLRHWQNWRDIMESVPIGVIARPGKRLGARRSQAAVLYRHARLKGKQAHLLGQAEAPAWAFQNVPMRGHSSSAIRAAGKWQREEAKT